MVDIIDFDDVLSFPDSLSSLNMRFVSDIVGKLDLRDNCNVWEIKKQMQDLHIDEMPIIDDYLKNNMNQKIAVWHASRLMNNDDIWTNGLVTDGGRESSGEKRINSLLEYIGLGEKEIKVIMNAVYYYWYRDKDQRTQSVHFFFDKNLVYNDDRINAFALNLGGEVLRWSLESIGKELFKKYPYKRLWIEGRPSIIKFQCALSNVHPLCRKKVLAEIIMFSLITKHYGLSYDFEFTGMTVNKIPPKDIISIETIKDYVGIQQKYSEYKDFY